MERLIKTQSTSVQTFGYTKQGYSPGNISETTEYGRDDWNLAQLARGVGNKDDAAKYQQLSESYKQIVDDVPGMIQLDGGNDLFIAKLRDFFERSPVAASWI
jgi:putative alpha-1,2-mannosidase